jgi:hypothetical protein
MAVACTSGRSLSFAGFGTMSYVMGHGPTQPHYLHASVITCFFVWTPSLARVLATRLMSAGALGQRSDVRISNSRWAWRCELMPMSCSQVLSVLFVGPN